MSTREEILEQARSLPSLPLAAVRVIQLVQNPHVSVGDLRTTIEYDPGLTSNILRMANSPVYKGAGEIASVRDALVRLGTRTVLQLVVSVAVVPVARRPVAGYDLSAGDLLRHAIGVAVGTDLLANRLSMTAPQHAYTAGLLHDLGKVALGTFLEVDAKPIRQLAFEKGMPFEQAESAVLGTDHAEVGAELLKSWNVPPCIVDVVRWHHEPENFTGEDTSALDLVHVADIIGQLSGVGLGTDGLNYRPCPEVIERLHITSQISEEVTNAMLTELRELEGLFLETSGEVN